MKELKKIVENENSLGVNLGSFDAIHEHSCIHPTLNAEIPGKIFLGEILKATSFEVSFQSLAPKAEIPFYHTHNENEELYVFIKGKGEFVVDDDRFEIEEGSVIRVSPKGRRTWKNTSDEPLVFMVVQSKYGSLNNFSVTDGNIIG